jgi:SAM-dependent methyltransferase
MSDAELERIRSAYRERDAATESPYRWENPGYVSYLQQVERALLRAFAETSVQLEGARVLDVGCGSGYFLDRLREYGAGECHGIDLMETRIAQGSERYPALELHVGSATRLPFDEGEFDLVTQFTCLSSIVDADVRLAAAREMQRVAKGWVLSFDMRGRLPRVIQQKSVTPTVGLDKHELRRLFGEPTLMRRVALAFDLGQLIGRYTALTTALAALPPLRSHLVALWRMRRPDGT